MRIIRRVICYALIIMCILSCVCMPVGAGASVATYDDYREIPGVTEEEINAIEAFKASGISFRYGMNYSTETFYDENGQIGGYTSLFCDWLSSLFGIPFVPETYEWDELVAGLADGEIDFTGELTASAERREQYFMTETTAERMVKIFRLQGSESISDISKTRSPRYIFLEGTMTRTSVTAASEESFVASYVSDYAEAVRMLRSGEVDAFFEDGPAEAAFDEYPDIVADNFFPIIFVPVSLTTQKAELEPFITVIDKYLEAGVLEHLVTLYNQGNQEYLHHKLMLLLTDTERAYMTRLVAENIPVPVAMEYDNYPAGFYNDREKEWQGIAIDVLAQISLLTGLTFVPANEPDTEWFTLLEMLESGEAAMITEMLYTPERAKRFIWATAPYSVDSYALISLMDHEDISINQVLYSKIGLSYETAYSEVFLDWFPDHTNTVTYMTIQEGFDALEAGEIDLLMGTRNLLLSVTNYLEKPYFKANIVFDKESESVFGFQKEQRVLRSIISKAQSLVDTESIAQRWTRKVFDYRSKVAREQLPYLIGFVVLLLAALILVLVFAFKNRHMNQNLEVLVKRRTEELEVQTQAAQVASRAKGDFLARMSHEIRTPLNAIIGMSHIARQAAEGNEKAQSSIDEIIKASGHLLGVLNDVLDMSKIESGKFTLSSEPFSLTGAMQEVVGIIAQRCNERDIRFITNVDHLPKLMLLGDKLRLNQVLINLLGNAVKFTNPEGLIDFTVVPVSQDAETITLTFTVRDDGIGMTPEQMQNLFIAFEQADETIAARFGGTGLGLAISQNLIGSMGGEITVTSEQDQGSAFTFTLPFVITGEDTPQEETAALETLDLRGKHVLLAEDIEINRLIVQEVLASTGLVIDEAEDGAQAVQMFEASAIGHYDLIFMDIQMPTLNGYGATEQIRALPRPDAATVPIIAMTANAYREDIERVLAAGMNGHLSKPIDIAAVHKTLAEYLADAPS